MNSLGTLDSTGRATAQIIVPGMVLTPAVGTTVYFAYPLFENLDFASNPIPVEIVN